MNYWAIADLNEAHFGKLRIGRAERVLCAFVMVLSSSRMLFLRFFLGQAQSAFLQGHQPRGVGQGRGPGLASRRHYQHGTDHPRNEVPEEPARAATPDDASGARRVPPGTRQARRLRRCRIPFGMAHPDGLRHRQVVDRHVRRKFFEAQSSAPTEAQQALELILDVYRVEHQAKERGVVRTPEHLHLRQTLGQASMERFHQWLLDQQGWHLPKSPMGEALSYALHQWDSLCRFLHDVRIPVDNNASERALKVVALGRKNFLFVGHQEAGDRLAGLYSLVATCLAHGVDHLAYLRDVLLRVETHPAARIDELLPHMWRPPQAQDTPTAPVQLAA